MLHHRCYAETWIRYSPRRPWMLSRFLWMLRFLLLLAISLHVSPIWSASYRTQNFIVTAATPDLARSIGDAAEHYRAELAVAWLGAELPAWPEPCPISAKVDPRLGAGGATSFVFEMSPHHAQRLSTDGRPILSPGTPRGWDMTLQGSRERVLDSVLPHEVTHTIFATHFGRPLPRWADEGACTTVEHESEKKKQERLLYEFLTSRRGIAFNRMFAMTEYPADILPLYSQGYSLARYLIAQGGRQKFVAYVGDGMENNDWTGATRRHYQFENLSELQVTWLDWVRRGGNELDLNGDPTTEATLVQQSPGGGPGPSERTERSASTVSTLIGKTSSESEYVPGESTSWYARPNRDSSQGDVHVQLANAEWPQIRETATESSVQASSSDEQDRRLASGDRRGDRSLNARRSSPPSPLLGRTPPRTSNDAGSLEVYRSARPEPGAAPREVLLEWGTPGPSLSPELGARVGGGRDLRK